MYESFYSLRERPFSLLPDPDFLYLSKNHGMALAMLQYALSSRVALTLVTGEIGCGKSTLIRQLLREIDDRAAVGVISNTHRAFGDLQQWVAQAFGLEYRNKGKAELHDELVDFLIKQYAQGRYSVLIVDEAQNLDPDTLEELRILSNINVDKYQILQLIVAGQPELRETLRRPELLQIAQRVGVDYHLEALSTAEVVDYIRHRLHVAGGDRSLFEADAIALIAVCSGGVPRLINTLCDLSLVYGFARQEPRISAEIVEEVVQAKAKSGIFPMPGAAQSEPTITTLK